MYSLYNGGPGVLPRKLLETIECRKSHLPHFWDLFFIFLFSNNQFSLFLSANVYNFMLFFIFKPSFFSNHFFFFFFFAYYSLINIKLPLFSNQ